MVLAERLLTHRSPSLTLHHRPSISKSRVCSEKPILLSMPVSVRAFCPCLYPSVPFVHVCIRPCLLPMPVSVRVFCPCLYPSVPFVHACIRPCLSWTVFRYSCFRSVASVSRSPCLSFVLVCSSFVHLCLTVEPPCLYRALYAQSCGWDSPNRTS